MFIVSVLTPVSSPAYCNALNASVVVPSLSDTLASWSTLFNDEATNAPIAATPAAAPAAAAPATPLVMAPAARPIFFRPLLTEPKARAVASFAVMTTAGILTAIILYHLQIRRP